MELKPYYFIIYFGAIALLSIISQFLSPKQTLSVNLSTNTKGLEFALTDNCRKLRTNVARAKRISGFFVNSEDTKKREKGEKERGYTGENYSISGKYSQTRGLSK
jgi:hypothetical protein